MKIGGSPNTIYWAYIHN